MFKKLAATSMCVVVGLVAVSDATAAGRNGKVASGKTGQGRSIRIKVMPNAVKLLSFSIELRCGGGYTLIDQESNFLPSPTSRTGQIHDAQVGSTDEVQIRGHHAGSTVKGRIRVRDRLGKHRCSSPWVKFTARERR
jgi:hypothetical protein